MMRNNQGAIVSYTNGVSCHHISEEFMFVGMFNSVFRIYNRANMQCIEKILFFSPVKNISSSIFNLLCVCLQDDTVVVINLANRMFLRILGHKSFVS